MTAPSPTKRPTDATQLAGAAVDLPSGFLNLPWIDVHNHAHTLSWEDRERFSLAGCRAMLLVAAGHHWTPYRPVEADDVRFLLDDAINRRRAIERNHFFAATLAVGIHTGILVEGTDALLDAMRDYGELEAVVAVGETGVTPSQHARPWDLDGQRDVVRSRMEIADDHDLPVLLHTPSPARDETRPGRSGLGVHGYEKVPGLERKPVIESENPALEAGEIDVEAARDAGLDEDRIVASHADSNNLRYRLEETDCYVSSTVGHSWLTGVTAVDVADAIETYGPDRIMIDTDCANIVRTDPLALKRAMFALYRLGIDDGAIEQVVLENPRDVFAFEL